MTAKAAYAARKRYRLDDIAVRGSGHTPSQRHPEYWDGDVPWLSLADSALLDKGWITNNNRNITPAGIANSSAVLHPRNTVVLLRDAGVGKSGILGKDMAVSQHFMAWQADEKVLHHRYLYQWLQWMAPEFERMAVGSTVKTIGLPYFKKLAIDLPTLDTQVKVADALQAADMAIEHAESLATNLDSRHQGLMQQLLTGRQRLKGFKGAWQTKRLGTFLTRVTRKNTAGCTRALTVSAQRGLVEQGSYFAKQMAAEDNEHYLLLQRGEFAYNRSAALGCPYGAIKRLDDFDEGIVSTLCLCFGITDPKAVHTDYMNAVFDAGLLNRQLRAIAHEGARSHGLLNVTSTDFFKMQLSLPSPPEQAAIAEVLNEAAEAARLQRQQLQVLQQQKRALLQRLLSGEPT